MTATLFLCSQGVEPILYRTHLPKFLLNMLAEVSATEISKTDNPTTFEENRDVAKKGGEIAGQARENIEKRTGKSVITFQNATELNKVVTDLIEGVAENVDEEK